MVKRKIKICEHQEPWWPQCEDPITTFTDNPYNLCDDHLDRYREIDLKIINTFLDKGECLIYVEVDA